jgi:putative N6-adenine-specific DNA methylase
MISTDEPSGLPEFFVVALPGLEDLVLAEVREWFPHLEAKAEHGGITIFAPLEEGLAMNLVLKTATRILLRVKRFRCRDFPKLFNFVAKIPWKDFIDPTCDMNIEVSTRLSRLKMKNRIQETCLEAWNEYVLKSKNKTVRGKSATMYVRLHNDDCTISLDTTGDRLHKRGQREFIGEAPLRESIAAALIKVTAETDTQATEVEVIDPMMGSGTFLLEALSLGKTLSERDFAFEHFNTKPAEVKPRQNQMQKVLKVIGFESDKKTFAAAQVNLKATDTDAQLAILNEDFFNAKPLAGSQARRWLFCNPPYGERLKVDGDIKDLYQKLFAASAELVNPDRACFLLPAYAVKGKLQLPTRWKVLKKRPFINGGIPVIAFVFGVE